MQTRLAFATMFGVSEVVIHRAERLLEYEVGRERAGGPVSVRAMLLRLNQDPEEISRRLMLAEPLAAVNWLSRLVSNFKIDGEPAADPAAVARAALAYAGRVVTKAQINPEISFLLAALTRLRHWGR